MRFRGLELLRSVVVGLGCGLRLFEFRVWGLGHEVCGLRLWVWALGLGGRMQGLRFRDQRSLQTMAVHCCML